MANNDFDGIRVEMAKGIVEGLKKDLALKTLAKIVAEGKASSEQKEEFDRCIQSGNKMPLPPEVQLYANHPAATPTPDMPSMLLSLPKEIRLEIYRYLILPVKYVFVGRRSGGHLGSDDSSSDDWSDEDTISFDGDNSDMEIEYDGPGGVDGLGTLLWSMAEQQGTIELDDDPEFPSNPEAESILDEVDPAMPAPDDIEVVNLEDGGTATRTKDGGKWETNSTSSDGTDFAVKYRMWPEILRVNKQIYEEASSMFFTEATIVICCNDLFFLSNKAFRMGTIFGENPWRYNPLTAVAKKLPGGTIQYDQEDLGGWLEPHMFAKFQKVVLDCALEVEHTENVQLFFDVETGKFDSEDETRFRNYIRNLTFVKDFVKILSKSSVVNQLTINVLVEVTAETRLDAESIDTEDEEEMEEMDEKQDMADLEANIAATEIFMDCGLFKTLRHLKNVRKLEFRTGFADFEPPVDYKPKEKHQIMAQKLKSLVERNFKAPEESTRGGLRSQGSITQHGAL
ncbi:hypothetical protein BCIN_16g01910 [Botrytis cinerea B05.10]|uniref:F-box domain-containing protein n=3 Tax=Botryotinia fuckeliana TaxID=40559 RepID=A0A384K6G8_BOTFB|nr:hypothetical protein BCIN_16g01910 [Botrytis cinerea B05.10]ATZ58399.1 hypothetical protein BCIN_16g01910 [Botrytis cinerea B05.10]EMR83372.1 hypothetical protein BcDW1_7999 [Botrytis cinerea BcDW1]CCD48761.1 hypothetical protein BofuT4_P034030.1 [Botrytis cinerea T4]